MQVIEDSANNVQLKIEFLKVPQGKNGGSWAARISGQPMDNSEFIPGISDVSYETNDYFRSSTVTDLAFELLCQRGRRSFGNDE